MNLLEAHRFVELSMGKSIIDVRSPLEFRAGHMPGAINIPLFTDTERAYIGTIYSKLGQNTAINAGFKVVEAKLASLAKQLLTCSQHQEIFLYCWRGGMRSRSMAWLAEQYKINPIILVGGYKAFRKQVSQVLSQDLTLIILSGFTGIGKTSLLHDLAAAQEPIIDLEKLANHKGSAFGNLHLEEQPSQEHFENLLAHAVGTQPSRHYFWVEDESRTIGKIVIPEVFWNQMRQSPIIQVNASLETRVQNLIATYGNAEPATLIAAFQKIQKKLGALATQKSIQAIENQDLIQACQIALHYYDKAYTTGLHHRENIKTILIQILNQPKESLIQQLIQAKNSLLA